MKSVSAAGSTSSDPQREFAVSVVRTLRAEGFEALWAGGCVRDALLGLAPKDYDVATTAIPDDVIRIFGPKRTVAVGASFGVIMVLAPKKSGGQVEVATFRRDGDYLDGRRPVSIEFCAPAEDARRRDFTINGLFYDPVSDQVIDYVNGQQDLRDRIVRAIGNPEDRFREDKLRMLRAVRVTATFGFQLDQATADAIRLHCRELHQVSVERIAQELRRMLAHPTRGVAVRLLEDTRLLPEIFPEICTTDGRLADSEALPALEGLQIPSFESALAGLLRNLKSGSPACPGTPEDLLRKDRQRVVQFVCLRLKLSNDESSQVGWLLNALEVVRNIAERPLHVVKPLLAHPHAARLIDLAAAVYRAVGESDADVRFCREFLNGRPPDRLSPSPLITGNDVLQRGVSAGPSIRRLLNTIRDEQLDELLTTREQALARLQTLIDEIDCDAKE